MSGDINNPLVVTTQDEGVAVATRPVLNFTGAGVVAVDDPANNQVDITIAGGGSSVVAEGRPNNAGTLNYIIPGCNIVTVTTFPPISNRLYHELIYVATDITIDQMAMEVTVAAGAGSKARLGIYSADTDWQPVALVLDAGTIDIDAVGVQTIAVNQTLTAGRYLLVFVADANATFRMVRGGNRYVGFDSGLGGNIVTVNFYRNFAFAALPDPPSDWDTSQTSAVPAYHMIFLRVSVP